MTWWNLFGFNPKFDDFVEAHPDKTLLGLGWSFYWRFFLLILSVELMLAVLALTIGGIFKFFSH